MKLNTCLHVCLLFVASTRAIHLRMNVNDTRIPIVIKSLNRVAGLRNVTYRLLERSCFNLNMVYIFVSTAADMKEYTAAFPQSKVILGPMGIRNINNFIRDYMPANEPYIHIIDDVVRVQHKHGKSMREVSDLSVPLTILYQKMLAAHASYGGFYPAANPAWLQHTTTTHLCLVMEAMCICINKPGITYLSHYKGDYERTILHIEDSGCVVRVNSFSVVAKYYKGSGGIVNRSSVSEYNAAVVLANRFPKHISGIKENRFGTSLRLRRLTEKVGPTKTSKACEAAAKAKIKNTAEGRAGLGVRIVLVAAPLSQRRAHGWGSGCASHVVGSLPFHHTGVRAAHRRAGRGEKTRGVRTIDKASSEHHQCRYRRIIKALRITPYSDDL